VPEIGLEGASVVPLARRHASACAGATRPCAHLQLRIHISGRDRLTHSLICQRNLRSLDPLLSINNGGVLCPLCL
jgi:hypothetical protein